MEIFAFYSRLIFHKNYIYTYYILQNYISCYKYYKDYTIYLPLGRILKAYFFLLIIRDISGPILCKV